MTVVEKKLPTSRFPGFDEKVRFNPLISLSVDGIKNGISNNPGRNQYDIKHINVVNLYSEDIIHTEDLEYIDVTSNKFSNYKVEYGDVFFTRSSLVLEGIAKCNINTDSESNLVFDDHIMRIRPDKNMIDPMYLKIFCSTYRARKYFMERAKTATMTTIGQNDISNLPVSIVSLEEQQKIGNFFRCLDLRIAAEKKMLGLLQEQKKGYMQKLFNQELRFKDQDNKDYPDWRDVTLEEICLYKSSSISLDSFKEYDGEKIYPLYDANSLVLNIDKYDQENDYISIIKDGAGAGRIRYCEGKSSVLGTMGYLLPINTVDIQFLYFRLQIINFSSYISGSTIPHIYFKDYKKENIVLPCEDEQKKISNLLSMLEKNVEKSKKKIEFLKQQKNGLMQQMFV